MTVRDIKNILKSYFRKVYYDKNVYLVFLIILISYLYINAAINNNHWLRYQRAGSLADLLISFSENNFVLIPFYVLFLLYGLKNEQLFHIRIRYQDNKMKFRILIISLINTIIFICLSVFFSLLIGSFFCRYFINFDSIQSEYFIHTKEIYPLSFVVFLLMYTFNYIIKLLWNCLAVSLLYIKKIKPFIIILSVTIFNFIISKLSILVSFNLFGMTSYGVYKEFDLIPLLLASIIMISIFIFDVNYSKFDITCFYKMDLIKWFPVIILTLFSLQNFNTSCHFYLGNEVKMTLGDAVLHIFRGTGSLQLIKITQLNFVWIFIFFYFGILICEKIKNKTSAYGIQTMIRYEHRYQWWNHQVLEIAKIAIIFYACIYSVSFIYCLVFGEISLVPTPAIQSTLHQIEIGFIELPPLYVQVILVPFGVLITLGSLILAITEWLSVIHALIVYIVLILLPIFYSGNLIFTKFLMLENNGLINTAVQSTFGFAHIFICGLCMLIGYYVGLKHFKNRDILNSTEVRGMEK